MSADQPTPRVGDTITTAEQLDALPAGSVVRHDDAGVSERMTDAWLRTGTVSHIASGDVFLPVTVLYCPDAPHPAPVGGDAVERAARAMQVENHPKPDPLNRDQREEQDEQTLPAYRALARAALAATRAGEAERSAGDGVDWTLEQWQEWSNEVASEMPEEWDGDEAQEDLILRFVKHAAAHLATCRASAGEAVDREALIDLLLSVGHVEWDRGDASNVADHVLALLAARGAAAPTVSACPSCGSPSRFEVRPPCSLDRYDAHDWHNPGQVTP